MSASIDCIDDRDLPTLSAVLNPLELGEHLHQFLPSQTKALKHLEVRILRYHAGKRCVVEITLRTSEGPYSLIGKVYARDRSDVYQLMEKISRAGFGPCDEFSIPQPTAYLPELHLLLQERVEGPRATESFLSENESERTAVAERCARWLARFHAIAPRMEPIFHLGSYLRSIDRWFRRLALPGQPFADKATQLFERLEIAASKLHGIEMCATHGSYNHSQLILAQGRTVTFDWDKSGLADPSRDVARFVIALRRLALRRLGSFRALDAAAEVFLKTYLSRSRPEALANLRFFVAAVCLQLAESDVYRREVTLEEGHRILEQGV